MVSTNTFSSISEEIKKIEASSFGSLFNQGKYILNMIDGQVLNINNFNKTFKLKRQYGAADLKLDYYNN
mgnify:CR=1 FL=1